VRHIPAHTRAIYFDAVGTLLIPEPSPIAVYAEIGARFGLVRTVAEVRTRFHTAFQREEETDRDNAWRTSEPREYERWHRIVTFALDGVTDLQACFHTLYEHYATAAAWRLPPDTGEVLRTLAERGFILGMGSNYDARLHRVLANFPALAPVCDRVLVSAAVGVRKPGREFFHAIARDAGCEPHEVVFVGDDVNNDYDGATAAGMHAILIDPNAKHTSVTNRVANLRDLLAA
jgi:putative hydrolase of the HAD superfamily